MARKIKISTWGTGLRFDKKKGYIFFEQLVRFNEHIKPTLDKEGNHRCPRCLHRVDSHYCSECGGALEWEDK